MIKQERFWWDPLSIGCLIIMLFLASYSLEDTVWVADLNRVTTLALLGVTIGLVLGQSQFNAKYSFWLGLIASIEFLSWQIIFINGGNISWPEKAFTLYARIHNSIEQLLKNQPLQDGVLFFIGMTLLFWFLGLFSGYTLTRHGKPWLALLMAGIIVFSIQLFQPSIFRNNLLTALYVFLLLILNARLNYFTSHQDWEKRNAAEDKDTYSIINRFVLVLAGMFILIAWSTPYLIKVATSGSDAQLVLRDRFKGIWLTAENFFAPFKQKPTYQRGFLGDSLALGTGRSIKEDILFTVSPPSSDFYRNRYYWRGRFYEWYQDGFWQNNDFSDEKYLANQSINVNKKTDIKEGRFSVQVNERQFSIFSPQLPLSINRETTLLISNNRAQHEVITIIPDRVLESGEKYELNGAIINPYLEELLSADGNNPQWVTETYLQLPENISPKIQELAIVLTQNKFNAYDKIQAITKYLRENFSYVDSFEDLPLDNPDPVEWFLFTKKSGYCTYFASAEVLLLRSIGIPARLVVGYAQGMPRENGRVYEVRDKDNHAWPEVYFNGIGWITFEPTPSQPSMEFLSGETPGIQEDLQNQGLILEQTSQPDANTLKPNIRERKDFENLEEESGAQSNTIGQGNDNWYLIGFGVAFLTILIVINRVNSSGKPIPVVIETKLLNSGITSPVWLTRWAHYVQLLPIGRLFYQLDFMILLLGNRINLADTPRQKVALLQGLIPGGLVYLNLLLEEYERESYSPYQADLIIARKSVKAIWKLILIEWSMNIINNIKQKYKKYFRR